MHIVLKEGEELHVGIQGVNGLVVLKYRDLLDQALALDELLTPKEKRAANTYGRIRAIKLMRERTGLGLRESKDIVDAWMERHHCCVRHPLCYCGK
jgi:hypothetical protein